MATSEQLKIVLGTQARVGDTLIGVKGVSSEPSNIYAKLRVTGGAEPARVTLLQGESAEVAGRLELRLDAVVGPEPAAGGSGPGSGHILLTVTALADVEE